MVGTFFTKKALLASYKPRPEHCLRLIAFVTLHPWHLSNVDFGKKILCTANVCANATDR